MKLNISTQLKAAFLLTVFALNTIVGFACSIEVDMGFNTTHHHDDEKEVAVHLHSDGKKHKYYEEETNDVSEASGAEVKAHHHNEEKEIEVNDDSNTQSNNHHEDVKEKHQDSKKDDSKKDGCCNDKVVKISQSAKAVSNSITLLHPVFFTSFVSVYCNINVTYSSQVTASVKYFVRGHHPPIPDIRIAIQSFQI